MLKSQRLHYNTFVFLGLGILAIFIIRTALAVRGNSPVLNDLFTLITLAGSLTVFVVGYRCLHKCDWLIAVGLGAVVGVSMPFATLFTPYPFFGVVRDNLGQALVRGFCVTLASLGGLVIMRQDGPVKILATNGEWKKSGLGILFGLAVGLPLAVVNVFALQLTQDRGIDWQVPWQPCWTRSNLPLLKN